MSNGGDPGRHDTRRRPLPPGYRREWSEHFARAPETVRVTDRSVLVFRIGREWLALPSAIAVAASDPASPRRLPHLRDPVVLGLVNLRGRLFPCLSLAHLLQIEEHESGAKSGTSVFARMLAVQFAAFEAALPVSEVWGLHRYGQHEVETPPAAATLSTPRYITGVLSAGDKRIGCLDAELLGQQLARRIK